MIIPWSHDSGELTRRPWVTYGLVVACVLGFLASGRGADPILADAGVVLDEAFGYWSEHPYLEPPARLVQAYGDPRRNSDWDPEASADPVAADDLAREQAELDAIVAGSRTILEDHVWYRHGFVPSAATPTGILGHLFLHAGWLHLLGNMLLLLVAGPFLEDRWGRGLFGLFYLASGLAGAMLFAQQYPSFDGPLIGASGAVAGVLGAFLVRCWNARIRFVYWFIIFFGSFRAPAWLVLPLWFGSELASALWSGDAAGGVAYWAHVGGFVFGASIGVAVRFAGIESEPEWIPPTEMEGMEVSENAAQAAPVRLTSENLEEDPAAVARFVAETRAAGRASQLPQLLAEPLWKAVEWRKRESALALFEAACAAGPLPAGPPKALLQLASWLRSAGQGRAASEALHLALPRSDAAESARIAKSARRTDPVLGFRAAERALAMGGLGSDELTVLEMLLAETQRTAQSRGIILVPDGAQARSPRMGMAASAPSAHAPGRASEDAVFLGAAEDAGFGADLQPGEAIEIPELAEPEVAVSLPDPEDGADAFLDSLQRELGGSDADARGMAAADAAPLALDPSGELSPIEEGPSVPGDFSRGIEVDFDPELGADPLPELDPGLSRDSDVAHKVEALDDDALGELLGGASLSEVGTVSELDVQTVAGAAAMLDLAPAQTPDEPPPALPLEAPADEHTVELQALSASERVSPPAAEEDVYASTVSVDAFDLEFDEKEPESPPQREVRAQGAVPVAFGEDALSLKLDGGRRVRLPLAKLDALAAVGVRGLAADPDKAVLILDLIMGWNAPWTLRVVRLRSDRFDPRSFAPGEDSPLQALRGFVRTLSARSRAVSVPTGSGPEEPFRIYDSLQSYEAEVLGGSSSAGD